jgi:hypothetical protein
MVNSQYKRVSRKRVCLICGKPDWCSYTPDEKISFCARVIDRADRVSRTGWGVFYHEKSLFPVEPLPFPRRPPPKKAELAPIEIRDFAYRKLIELAPATGSEEIIDGPKGLRARKILDFENYGSLPQSRDARAALAKHIRNSINRYFPDYAGRQKCGIKGLPGFWLDRNGKAQLWLNKDYDCPMMLIPYRDRRGLVQACQIRFMRQSKQDGLRYLWLSTPEKSGGASCGCPLHFAGTASTTLSESNKPILATEGALKAETVRLYKPDYEVVATGGVSCSHELIISAARFRPLVIAFDNDYVSNHQVLRQLVRLCRTRFHDAKTHNYDFDISFLHWHESAKGLDDALLSDHKITRLAFFEWLRLLDAGKRDDVLEKVCYSTA